MEDLKVLVDKDSFHEIQDYFLSVGVRWANKVRPTARKYEDDCMCLYFNAESRTIQYGIHKYNFDVDKAKEVSIDKFKSGIKPKGR